MRVLYVLFTALGVCASALPVQANNAAVAVREIDADETIRYPDRDEDIRYPDAGLYAEQG